jgi:hypothetical protein
MKRTLVVALALVGVIGAVALAQCGCVTPEPEKPSCYSSFWAGEPIKIELRVPLCFCFCCCCETPQVLGWRVEAWADGTLIYSAALDAPVAPAEFSATWDQTDATGVQVAAGYYTIVVSTTAGEYETYARIVERPEGCCFWPFLGSWPCFGKLCEPHVVLSRTCMSPCQIKLFVGPCCP